jgi:CO/xanthine dehydrogenase FAD-binding subunit
MREAARKAAQEANPRTSLLRGSEEYRREMVANLVERGIRRGLERLEVRHG